jgi:glycosyltransferase involved in cell wall biosynthesis
MTPPRASSAPDALFLSPEEPKAGSGGGGLRSASLLAFLQTRYNVTVKGFDVPYHSKSPVARAWRNGIRVLRGVPPLLDRFSGFESQLEPVLRERHYAVGVIEHFWCAPYAASLRPHCERLVLDLHNVESALASTHADATRGLSSIALRRFAESYRRLEERWLQAFDMVLVTSEDDARRIEHPNIVVYPNALPEIPRPWIAETDSIVFSGNLEYHPNVEAIRWFRSEVWPALRGTCEWRLIGKNPEAVEAMLEDEKICVVGPVHDAIAAIAEAKVCIVPLRSGSGTRFKILEAWAAGRPVVSTTLGAEGLGAVPGEHLLIADDPAAFIGAIQRLFADSALRRELGEAGRGLYLDRFTWPTAWQSLRRAGL